MSQFDKWGVTMEAEEKAGPDPQKFGAFFQLDWSLPPTAAPFQCPPTSLAGCISTAPETQAGRAARGWAPALSLSLNTRR